MKSESPQRRFLGIISRSTIEENPERRSVRSSISGASAAGRKCSEQDTGFWIGAPPAMTPRRVRSCGRQFRTDRLGCATPSLVLVTQGPAGGFVDEVHTGAGRAGRRLIAIRPLSRRLIRQPNLNVHTCVRAPKDKLGHPRKMAGALPDALTCLKPRKISAFLWPALRAGQNLFARRVRLTAVRIWASP